MRFSCPGPQTGQSPGTERHALLPARATSARRWTTSPKTTPLCASNSFPLRDAIEALRKEMLRGDTNRVEANSLKLAEFQRSLFDDVRDTFQALRTQDNRAPLSVGGFAAGLARPVHRRHGQIPADGVSQGQTSGSGRIKKCLSTRWASLSERHRDARAALPLHGPAQGQLPAGGVVFAGGNRASWCSFIFAASPASCSRSCRWPSVRFGWAA